jgi:ElaB/YqjD/DUF883 family membrane-anchored ribosome-binding protein
MTAIESRETGSTGSVDPTPNGHSAPADVTALRREIEQTRAQLGATVEALAAKADVKARAQEAVDDAKSRARAAMSDAQTRVRESMRVYPQYWAAGALAGVVVLVASIVLKRRGNR